MQELCVCENEWYFIINTSVVVVVNFVSCFILILLGMLCCVVCVICCLKMINFTHCAPDVQLGCQTVWILALLKTSWCGLFMLFYLGLIIWDLELIHCTHTQADESVSSLEVKSPVKLANSGKHPEYGTSVIHFVYPEHTNPYCVLKSAMQN